MTDQSSSQKKPSGIKSVCVYCGSSSQAADHFKTLALDVGKSLAVNNYDVVYGGGHAGLMGLVAEAALNHGGEVYGVITDFLKNVEMAHDGLTELHVVETMHERKQKMVDLADCFLILPGGLGTLDEFFEIFTWWQLGLHEKPLLILNHQGYWDHLLALIDNIAAEKFCSPTDRERLIIIDTPAELKEALESAPHEKNDPKTKWM